VVDYNWQKMHGAVVDRINSGEVKSGAERASLNREKAVYERIMAGVASKKEIAAAKELYTARLRAREQRGRAAEKAPTQEQVVSASGAGGVAPKTGEPVSGAPSPEEAAIRQQEEARSAVTPLEQKYAELAASDPEGPKWVARLREAAATNKRLGIPWDESGILDDAIKTSNSLPGKRRRGGK
jgi:hypothetical protein